jgi:UDP-N-acetylmuramyl pentapeptide phosphotransferase/UDP-N-acetylglucosamine-1-phosphate transferase
MINIIFFIVLFIIEITYFKIAKRFNIIDKPNDRSSHSDVTLRGGGIIFYIGVLINFLFEGFQYPLFFMGLTFITFVSFADDLHSQSFKLRLSVQFIAMALMFYQWGLYSQHWYFALIALVFCIGILNAFNFMDGINGITGGYSLVVIGALWYINNYTIRFVDNKFIYTVISALLVFNFFNFRTKAKCFAGDVGAISIAFIILFLLGLLVIRTDDISYIIILVVYGIDSVLTIIHRLILKENIFQPHRKHVFQIMANELKIPQVLVSSFYGILQTIIIVGFIICKVYSFWYLGTIILILSLSYLYFKKKYFRLHGTALISTKEI